MSTELTAEQIETTLKVAVNNYLDNAIVQVADDAYEYFDVEGTPDILVEGDEDEDALFVTVDGRKWDIEYKLVEVK